VKKWIGLGAVVVVVVVGTWWVWRGRRPGVGAPAEEVVRFVASPGFGRMGEGQRAGYVARVREMSTGERNDAMGRAGLSAEGREAVLVAAYEGVTVNPIEEFTKLKTAVERRKYLDRMIAAGATASTKDAAFGDSDWRKRFLEGTSPEERARLAEFVSGLRQRRKELGLPE